MSPSVHKDQENTLTAVQLEELEMLRGRFFKRARQEVITWGEEGLDLAWTYYPSLSDDDQDASPRLVVDRIHLPRVGTSSVVFIESVAEDWWPARARVSADRVELEASDENAEQRSTLNLDGGDVDDEVEGLQETPVEIAKEDVDRSVAEVEAETEAICGFYARYINASGFTLVFEFNHTHVQDPSAPPVLWRVDARSKGTQIVMPQDEGDFYDQMGAYLDLRMGWSWLVHQSEQRNALVTAEVEPGYLIGVRPGDPMSDEDPAEREDPEIEAVFSRFDIERFDTLEFINLDDADHYPFQSERFSHWLTVHARDLLLSQNFEGFVLSQSGRFFDALEEVAERRRIEVSWGEDEEQTSVIFRRGPLWLERPFSLPYLWTLHSGRQHYEGVVDFFRDDLDRLYLASELYFAIKTILESAHKSRAVSMEIFEGTELLISTQEPSTGLSQERVRVPLIDWAAESVFEGKEGAQRFLKLWGWSEDTHTWSAPQHLLDQCPICQRGAHVTRAVRPQLDGADPVVIGAEITQELPDHLWGYYGLTCPHHHVPVFWRSAEHLQRHLEEQTHRVLSVISQVKVTIGEREVELLWGPELAGELLSVDTRESLRERGAFYAHAFTPDLLGLSMLPIEKHEYTDFEPYVRSFVERFGPDRDWRIHWSVALR